jgi:hypothetical protein
VALTTWTTWSRSRVDGQGEWGERECASNISLRCQIVFARWEVWTILQFVYTHTPPSHSLKSLCLLSLPWRCPEGASSFSLRRKHRRRRRGRVAATVVLKFFAVVINTAVVSIVYVFVVARAPRWVPANSPLALPVDALFGVALGEREGERTREAGGGERMGE